MGDMRSVYGNSGYIPSPEDNRDYELSKLVKRAVRLPEEYINPTPLVIFDQGTSSECVGCAFAQAKHIIEYRQTHDESQFSPSYIYANRASGQWTGEGMIPREALKQLKERGVCHYDDFSGFYNAYEQSKKVYMKKKRSLDDKAYPYRISSYYKLNTINEIKTAIYTLGFALVAYDVYDCMYYPDESGYVNYDETTKGECSGGHQVLAVGFDKDNLYIVNSWGEDYGVGFEENQTKGGMIKIPIIYAPSEAWAMVDDIYEEYIEQEYAANEVNESINELGDSISDAIKHDIGLIKKLINKFKRLFR